MAFIKFEDVGAKLTNSISLTKSQSFGFAGGFVRKYNISEFNFVSLLYDNGDGNNRVGFQFTKERMGKSSFKIIFGYNRQTASIVVRSFFRSFEIDNKKYEGKYEPTEINDENYGIIYFIDLKEKK
ncbi:MAG: hypothetical protein WC467_00850 [Patescibacteria group bacterium]